MLRYLKNILFTNNLHWFTNILLIYTLLIMHIQIIQNQYCFEEFKIKDSEGFFFFFWNLGNTEFKIKLIYNSLLANVYINKRK